MVKFALQVWTFLFTAKSQPSAPSVLVAISKTVNHGQREFPPGTFDGNLLHGHLKVADVLIDECQVTIYFTRGGLLYE